MATTGNAEQWGWNFFGCGGVVLVAAGLLAVEASWFLQGASAISGTVVGRRSVQSWPNIEPYDVVIVEYRPGGVPRQIESFADASASLGKVLTVYYSRRNPADGRAANEVWRWTLGVAMMSGTVMAMSGHDRLEPLGSLEDRTGARPRCRSHIFDGVTRFITFVRLEDCYARGTGWFGKNMGGKKMRASGADS